MARVLNRLAGHPLRYLSPLLIAVFACSSAAAAPKPNIVFILADDLGWSDVGFNGATFYETPNLDRLARDGVRFTDAYSGGPNCMPTRACLLSGMYTPRTQMWTPGGLSKGSPKLMKLAVPCRSPGGKKTFPSKLQLPPSVTSIAEVLNSAGYTTARFGKWHLGKDLQGFDISSGNGSPGDLGKHYGNINVAETLTDASVRFLEAHQDDPFFLYLSHWDVHTPIRARKEVVARYTQKLRDGDWDRDWNCTYAGMIEAVDTSVGRVRAKLQELGLDRNTLIVFSSDNGGLPSVTTNAPLHGGKGSFFEGGVRVPTCMTWPGVTRAGTDCETPITSVDFLPTFAEMAGAKLPTDQPVDGVSLVPLLHGRAIAERAIFWHFPLYLEGGGNNKVLPVLGTTRLYWRGVPSSMMRRGDWKLVHHFEDDSVRLYNVRKDIGERHDLAKTHPEKAGQMLSELRRWQQETNAVIPDVPNRAFDVQAGQKK